MEFRHGHSDIPFTVRSSKTMTLGSRGCFARNTSTNTFAWVVIESGLNLGRKIQNARGTSQRQIQHPVLPENISIAFVQGCTTYHNIARTESFYLPCVFAGVRKFEVTAMNAKNSSIIPGTELLWHQRTAASCPNHGCAQPHVRKEKPLSIEVTLKIAWLA